jgi:glucose/arabinose dehydrogenase
LDTRGRDCVFNRDPDAATGGILIASCEWTQARRGRDPRNRVDSGTGEMGHLKRFVVALVVLAASAGVAVETARNPQAPAQGAAPAAGGAPGQPPAARGRGPTPVDALGTGPWDLTAGGGRGGGVRVHVTAIKGLDHPWGIAFVPDRSMLVTERPGRLRVIRNGVVDPAPIGPLPAMLATGLGGLLDVSLHPRFATNRLIYLAYSKPGQGVGDATTAVYRARWDGGATLADGRDIFVARSSQAPADRAVGPASGSYGARLAWDKDGLLFVSLGERNVPNTAQEPDSHLGKIVRLTDDGSVPKDNPFIGKAGYLPEIYTLGHRNPLGLYVNPTNGELWSTEEGPQGGDELNVIKAGKNYGWPVVSLGRNYDGTIVGEGFTKSGLEEPLVFWVPAIAISGLSIYNGDAFPAWKGHAFVGAMRANTGQHIQRVWFNPKGEPIGREIFLAELKQRIREVKPGLDGLLYALTDETFGAVLKIEPAR